MLQESSTHLQRVKHKENNHVNHLYADIYHRTTVKYKNTNNTSKHITVYIYVRAL